MECTKKLHDDIGESGDIANIATFATTKNRPHRPILGDFVSPSPLYGVPGATCKVVVGRAEATARFMPLCGIR